MDSIALCAIKWVETLVTTFVTSTQFSQYRKYLGRVKHYCWHRVKTVELSNYRVDSFFFIFLFFKIFLADTYTCPILGPLIPLFWISGDVSSGFQSQSGLPYSHCGGERNVRSPRSTSGATRCRPLDGKHCGAPTGFISCPRILLAPVGLEPAIKRSWVLRANHSATRPGLSSRFLYRAKLLSYQTIEYIEQNCRVIELSSISSKTVELLVYSSARQFLWDFAVHAQYAQ